MVDVLRNASAMIAEREALRMGIEHLTVSFPTEVSSFDFQVECTDRTVQHKLNAQSLRLFGLHKDVNDAHRASANRLQNKTNCESGWQVRTQSWLDRSRVSAPNVREGESVDIETDSGAEVSCLPVNIGADTYPLHGTGLSITTLRLEAPNARGNVVNLLVRYRVMNIGKALLSTQDLSRCGWETVFQADCGNAYLVRKDSDTRITLVKKRCALRVKLKPHNELPYTESEEFLEVMSLDQRAGVWPVAEGGSSGSSGPAVPEGVEESEPVKSLLRRQPQQQQTEKSTRPVNVSALCWWKRNHDPSDCP